VSRRRREAASRLPLPERPLTETETTTLANAVLTEDDLAAHQAELAAQCDCGALGAEMHEPGCPHDPDPFDTPEADEHLTESVTLYAEHEAIVRRVLAADATRAAARARGMGKDHLAPALELLAKVARGE
jgi:hypothetical protein